MDNTHADENLTSNNNSEMVDELADCIDKKAWLEEISAGFTNKKLYDADDKQDNIHNYGSIKYEKVDNLTTVVGETDLSTDCTDEEMSLNKTSISGCYIKQEPCDTKDAQGNIQNYLNIKDENMDDLTVGVQKTELMTDSIDNKVCIYETVISAGCIKQEPCDTNDKSGSVTHNNVAMKGCEECGEEYDLYCLKCLTLIRIFDSNNPDGRDNAVRLTLPNNFIDFFETPSGPGVIALRIIPKGVVFGPFKGLDSIKDDTVSKWKIRNKELVYTKDPGWMNWMQYIRMAEQSSHQNLLPFQYEGGLYYRSECNINVGDELLVRWDGDNESEIEDVEDTYWEPRIRESLDHSYACTFCCVGYKLISHLRAHNSTCIKKRNKKDFCKEIVQCDICKVYLDKKEYRDYHTDRCYESNEKCSKRNRGNAFNNSIHRGDRPFSCTHCSYKATTKSFLKQHVAIHNDDKPFACTFCAYKTTRKSYLKQHMAVHNDDRPFACTLCSYKATTNSKLKQHAAIHIEEKPFACTLCPYKTTTIWQLNHHVAVHNGDKPFACALCPYKTTRKSILKRHVVVHNGDRPFACPFCSYKTNTNLTLKRHMVTHNEDRPFACTLCPYKAKTQPVLKHHVATHYDDRPFGCALCPYKAKTKSFLRQHIAIHNGDKPFACTLCPYKTVRKSFLKLHIALHNDDRPFACTLCPYKGPTKSKLKQHITIHNDDKPFACTLCPYKTTTSSQLKQHAAIHNDDKAFPCALCPYKTTRRSILKQHMAAHNDDRPFGCSLCSYKANTNLTLKRHVATHSDDRPFACALCPYKAKIQSVLKHHVATHNRVKSFACTFCPYRTTINSSLKRHTAIHSDDRPFVCTLCPYKATTSSNLKRHVGSHNK